MTARPLPAAFPAPPSAGLAALVALVGVPAALAACLTVIGLLQLLPAGLWWDALHAPDVNDPRQLLYRHAFLPRLLVTVQAGAALGLAGTLLQQALRNPLAEPTTIGTNAGASLALTIATLYAPWLLETGREWVAFSGGAATTLIVFALARDRSFSPVAIIITGLIVSLTCGSASALLMAINREYSEELFIWQTGSLVQNGDAIALALAPWIAVAAIIAFLLVRPLRLLDLSDEGAAGLGARPAITRLAALAVAVALSTLVVAAVGVIGFVALAAPALARLVGARTLGQRMVWAPLVGAALLWLTDRLVQIAPFAGEIPAGTATAFLGAPLLLLLLPRMQATPNRLRAMPLLTPHRAGWASLLIMVLILAVAALAAVAFGQGLDGWHWASPSELAEWLPLRAPRVIVSLAAGAMLAVAGTAMQRMTGNPMAAPEVLGVTGGASLSVLLLFLFSARLDRAAMFAAASAGALATLAAIVLLGRRHAFAPDRLLLAGIAIATVASAFSAILLASGDPRLDFLLVWLSGSTYRATAGDAAMAAIAMAFTLVLVPPTARWLDILPLGEAAPRALGLGLGRVRSILLILIAVPTAVSTLVVGPLSFVGLMAPHMARALGFQRALPQLLAAACLGALFLLLADWAGRTLIFPWQVPAGLLAALAGGPFFMILMWKGRR
ncbi:Fe(3+)-hydroxamate ABC transporter permease FhuB [Chelativorans alearense]|uniref:Fe(3+)-hydroxamate ABC transporter permease FhuB n=1 Tax=Chelativorans alearense TaxID=2681495 RepID=UPI0013D05FE4|nr:Fe(3+)-hydroxamate ABC transporter permease FhuB [Chelativorans alearense]